MKRLSIVLFSLILTAAAFAETVDIKIKGMVCSFCAHGLDKKFGAEPAVEDVKVTMEDRTVRLTLKKEKALSDAEIKKIVQDAGYDVDGIQRDSGL